MGSSCHLWPRDLASPSCVCVCVCVLACALVDAASLSERRQPLSATPPPAAGRGRNPLPRGLHASRAVHRHSQQSRVLGSMGVVSQAVHPPNYCDAAPLPDARDPNIGETAPRARPMVAQIRHTSGQRCSSLLRHSPKQKYWGTAADLCCTAHALVGDSSLPVSCVSLRRRRLGRLALGHKRFSKGPRRGRREVRAAAPSELKSAAMYQPERLARHRRAPPLIRLLLLLVRRALRADRPWFNSRYAAR